MPRCWITGASGVGTFGDEVQVVFGFSAAAVEDARGAAAGSIVAYDACVTSHHAVTPRPTRRVLVVCAGNICRSPTAEAVLRMRGADHPAVELEVRSRGTHDWNAGRHAHSAMTRIAAARGYDLSGHVAAQLNADDLAWADEVLVMDDDNHRQLLARYPDLAGRIRLLDASGIPDPWLVDEDPAYADALDRIERAVGMYLAGLEQAGGDERPTPE